MMRTLLVTGLLVLLTACGGGDGWTPPVYSGKQESTEGVPGFDRGQKRSPYVKLGQSYKVMGEWYVPRFQPDYDETGLASWYGPGFHGGKTANGEKFDKHSMTAAHKTLPLPSIVKVTMVETGKTIYVRINDRGPFSKGRIIDLSYAAAKEIGLMRKGVAKVRVQYMLAESQRFADLLAQGREPDEIDIAREVLPHAKDPHYAAREIENKANRAANDPRWFEEVGVTHAAVPARPLYSGTSSPTVAPDSVFTPVEKPVATAVPPPRALDPPASPLPPGSMMVQVGTFSMEGNAQALSRRIKDIGAARVSPVQRGDATLYRVQLGPYDNPEMAAEVLDRVHQLGLADARIVRP